MSWTDERVKHLIQLWREGLSASQIAAKIGGVTRNGVIGKIHRLNLESRTSYRMSNRPLSLAAPSLQHPRTIPRGVGLTQGSAALKVEFEMASDADEAADRYAWLAANILALKQEAKRISAGVDETTGYIAKVRAELRTGG